MSSIPNPDGFPINGTVDDVAAWAANRGRTRTDAELLEVANKWATMTPEALADELGLPVHTATDLIALASRTQSALGGAL